MSARPGPEGGEGGRVDPRSSPVLFSTPTLDTEEGDGDLDGCGDCPGGVNVGGSWARWGEDLRCVGRGSEEGCGSSEWTGVRVLKGRRPVGCEGSLG